MAHTDYADVAGIYDTYISGGIDVPFFVEETRRARGRVLELMAGTGRLSIPLIEAGANLTCVDGSAEMLAVLSEKLAQKRLRAKLVRADVREMALGAAFELALLPFNAFMELTTADDQRRTLAAVYAHLEPGGRFICTLHNPAVRRATVNKIVRGMGAFPAPEGTLVASGVEFGGDPIVTRYQFFELYGRDGLLVSKRCQEIRFALIERDDFEAMAADAGFSIVEFYGSYERAPFDPARSPSMIWVLEKRRS